MYVLREYFPPKLLTCFIALSFSLTCSVVAASELYVEVKTSRSEFTISLPHTHNLSFHALGHIIPAYIHTLSGLIPDRSMQDILLRATQEAQSIIMDCLNGFNFGQTFLTLNSHLQQIRDKKDTLHGIRAEVMQVQ